MHEGMDKEQPGINKHLCRSDSEILGYYLFTVHWSRFCQIYLGVVNRDDVGMIIQVLSSIDWLLNKYKHCHVHDRLQSNET